jgi:hypothetical protein
VVFGSGVRWIEAIPFHFCCHSKLVTEGKKSSTSFKKVHLNSCAKAFNDHFKINRTGDQISIHLKTFKKCTLESTT